MPKFMTRCTHQMQLNTVEKKKTKLTKEVTDEVSICNQHIAELRDINKSGLVLQ